MSDLKQTAVLIWNELLKAMVEDGMIARAISNTGPNTTQFILRLALDNLERDRNVVWIPIAITPSPTVEIFARDFDNPGWRGDLIHWNERARAWTTRDGRLPPRISHYLTLPDISKTLQPYRKPATPPKPEVYDKHGKVPSQAERDAEDALEAHFRRIFDKPDQV